jgi:hypothetical protein
MTFGVSPPRDAAVARGCHVGEMIHGLTDARLWHPRLRLNRVLRVMLHTPWSGEQWSVVMIGKAVALRGQIPRAGWFNRGGARSATPWAIPRALRETLLHKLLCDLDGVFRRAIAASIPKRLIKIEHPS